MQLLSKIEMHELGLGVYFGLTLYLIASEYFSLYIKEYRFHGLRDTSVISALRKEDPKLKDSMACIRVRWKGQWCQLYLSRGK